MKITGAAKIYLEALIWHAVIIVLGLVPSSVVVRWLESQGAGGLKIALGFVAVYSGLILVMGNLFVIPKIRMNARSTSEIDVQYKNMIPGVMNYWLNLLTAAAAIMFISLVVFKNHN